MVWGAIAGAVAPAVIGGLLGGRGGGSTRQQPLETPEALEARRQLFSFTQSGKFGDFRAGEALPLKYGDFGITEPEQTGLSSLQGLLRSGIPDQFRMGDEALRDLLQTSPEAIDAQFSPFKAKAEREIRDSETAFKRGAGVFGNLYSTNSVQNLGDIRSRGNETLIGELARLTDSAMNRRLSAIPLAFQSGRDQEDIAMGRIGASQTFGGLTRQLNDASIKARDAEILRRREEAKLPLQVAQGLGGQPPQFGVPEVSNPSPFQGVLDIASRIGGQYLGNQLSINQYRRAFPGSTPSYTANGTGMWR